jgi:hypothetical protein
MNKFLEGENLSEDELKRSSEGAPANSSSSRALRIFAQEQGRAVPPRRDQSISCRLRPIWAKSGASNPDTSEEVIERKLLTMSRSRPRVQDRRRIRSSASSPSSASTPGSSGGLRRAQLRLPATRERIGRIVRLHAGQARGSRRIYSGDIAAAVGSRAPSPDKRSATRTTRSCSRSSPSRAGHLSSRSSLRPKRTRRRWASRLRSSPKRIRLSASARTARPCRPSSRAWASFISTSWSTA